MLFWSGMLVWLAYGIWQGGWWVATHKWELTGLAIVALALVPLLSACHGAWLAVQILLGKTSPRMARRKFRNGIADVLMYSKTGLWKE